MQETPPLAVIAKNKCSYFVGKNPNKVMICRKGECGVESGCIRWPLFSTLQFLRASNSPRSHWWHFTGWNKTFNIRLGITRRGPVWWIVGVLYGILFIYLIYCTKYFTEMVMTWIFILSRILYFCLPVSVSKNEK